MFLRNVVPSELHGFRKKNTMIFVVIAVGTQHSCFVLKLCWEKLMCYFGFEVFTPVTTKSTIV
jgi:hypothetical protein